MNALCHGHLNLVSIHRRRGGRVSTTSEKRHGLRLNAGGKGELVFFGHVFLFSTDIMEKKSDATTLSVHRCRFVDYAPSAITALAFPPLPLPSVKGKKKKTTAGKQSSKFGLLAIGHANGNIDICEWMGAERQPQCSQAWVVRKVRAIIFSDRVQFFKKICT